MNKVSDRVGKEFQLCSLPDTITKKLAIRFEVTTGWRLEAAMPAFPHFVVPGMECGQSRLGLLVLPLVDNYQGHHTNSIPFSCILLMNLCVKRWNWTSAWLTRLQRLVAFIIGSGSLPAWFGESPKCGSPFLSAGPWSLEGQDVVNFARVYLICIVGIPTLTVQPGFVHCSCCCIGMCPLFLVQNSHRAWQKQQHRLNILWQQWRLEIQALGKAQKEHWPPPPPHVEPPAELFKVDTKWLCSTI